MDIIILIILIFKILLLTSSLFIPGYFLLSPKFNILIPKVKKLLAIRKPQISSSSSFSKLPEKTADNNDSSFKMSLSLGEYVACCFAISIFLIVNLSFLVGVLGIGIIEFFNFYFLVSSILAGFFILVNRKQLVQYFTRFIVKRSFNFNYLYIVPVLFVSIPLFHLFAYGSINWDAFSFFLRDSIAMGFANSIPNNYPDSFYPNDKPLIFFSYLASSLYLYSIESLDLLSIADSNVLRLVGLTTNSLHFLTISTFFTTLILLGSFAARIFKQAVLVVAVLILFIMIPLLNHQFYAFSLYADLFFAFETLLVIFFLYRFLQTKNNGRLFFFFMIMVGVSLAITTKTYGYVLLVVFPIIFVKEKFYSSLSWKNINRRHLALFVLIFVSISGLTSLHIIRDVELTGSPFNYSVESLVNYSPAEEWSREIIKSTIMFKNPENYPESNQRTSLLLGFGFYPLLMIPLVIGIALSVYKDKSRLGIVGIFVIFFYIIWMTVLQMRVDRHLFAILPLLPLLYILGIKAIADFFRWKNYVVLLIVLAAIIMQIPMFDAIYTHGKILDFFRSFYYWYTADNLYNLILYSLLGFGAALLDGMSVHYFSKRATKSKLASFVDQKKDPQHYIDRYNKEKKYKVWFDKNYPNLTIEEVVGLKPSTIKKEKPRKSKSERMTKIGQLVVPFLVFSVVFSILIPVQVNTILSSPKFEKYDEFIERTYLGHHNIYLDALQDVLDITSSEQEKPTLLSFHGWGTEYFTMGKLTYIRIDDPFVFASIKDIITEKDPNKVREMLLEQNIDYILLPTEKSSYYNRLRSLSAASGEPIILSNPSSVSSGTLILNKYWYMYKI